MSGTKTAAKAIQKLVGVKEDGIIGNISLEAINKANPDLLFYQLFNARQNYYEDIVKNRPANKKYLLGWYNRLFDFYKKSL